MSYSDGDNPEKCVFNNFGGKGHPYSYCIKTIDDMVPNKSSNKWGMDLTAKYVAGIFNYGDGLICNPEMSIKNEPCKGILGNRYVLETQQKCELVDSNGNPTGLEKTLSEYINNESDGSSILTGGNPSSCRGVIPSTLGAVGKINAFGILGAFIGPTKPLCKEVNVKCHLVDDKNTANNFNGYSGNGIYMNVCDIYNNMKDSDFKSGQKPPLTLNISGGIEGLCGGFLAESGITAFTNMYPNPEPSHLLGGCQSTKWGCCPGENQLSGKAKRDKKGSNCNDTYDNHEKIHDLIFNSDIKNINEKNNILDNDNLINLYIISISLLFMFIIFKLITKKK